MDEKRLGRNYNKAKWEWPELDFFGQPYNRGNVSIAGVGDEHFVVLPVNFHTRYIDDTPALEALQALQQQYQPKSKATGSKGSRGRADDDA